MLQEIKHTHTNIYIFQKVFLIFIFLIQMYKVFLTFWQKNETDFPEYDFQLKLDALKHLLTIKREYKCVRTLLICNKKC